MLPEVLEQSSCALLVARSPAWLTRSGAPGFQLVDRPDETIEAAGE